MKFRKYDSRRGEYYEEEVPVGRYVTMSVVALLLVVFLCVGGAGGCKEYGRYQKRADAKNRTLVVKQQIKTAQQQALVVGAQIQATKARAKMRFEESKGIRAAQDEIAATLTPAYIQHEAIQAMRESKATTVYIPSGIQGVPLVNDVSQHAQK